MSMLWMVSALDARALDRWAPVWTNLFDGYASREDLRARWRRWLDDGQPDESFAQMFSAVAHGGWKDFWEFSNECASELLTDVHVTRRCSAPEAFFHAIGPARARSLPGFLGNFVLKPGELPALLPGILAAFSFPPHERIQVRDRVDEALADSAPRDIDDVLDTLPRRARWAADNTMGLVSICQAIM
ncbi:hypothetical protein BL253_21320 [Pseudofrankia asymbiotica]|uniref:Uncharacterized protein n=1 Tax=Pseudofrankia asymbiotica TaxID=1834516 RepID=A0A1V2I7A5_9ACTN|nr:hypothetical protein BL253_21320 [Pseudofrankia asymbiotica]